MSVDLLGILARKERDRFFWRLDAQWGKGLRQRTSSDRSPDFRVATRPPKLTQYVVSKRVSRQANWVRVWSTEWVELAYSYAATLKAEEKVKTKVTSQEPVTLSANQSAMIEDIIAEYRAGGQNQTLVKRLTIVKPKVYRSLRLMTVKPAPIDLTDQLEPSPDRPSAVGLVTMDLPANARPAPVKPIAIQQTIFGVDVPIWESE